MTNYTLDNHLRYDIGERLFGFRENSTEKFQVSLGVIDPDHFRISNYRQELRRTADSVYRELGKDLVVLLSGGTDSEIVLRNFIEIGIKPKCVAIRFTGGYNDHDINEAIEISKELDVKLDVIDFDIKEFYKSGNAIEFGKQIQCTQLAYLMSYFNILKLDAPAVMGGEVLLSRHISAKESFWYYTFRENEDASAMRFSEKYNIPLVNEWFTYTPELILYYLENPIIKQLVTDRFNYKLTSVSTKNLILKQLYPTIRDKIKTHGFERLQGFNHESYREISKNQIIRLESSLDGIEYNRAIKQLKGNNGSN